MYKVRNKMNRKFLYSLIVKKIIEQIKSSYHFKQNRLFKIIDRIINSNDNT